MCYCKKISQKKRYAYNHVNYKHKELHNFHRLTIKLATCTHKKNKKDALKFNESMRNHKLHANSIPNSSIILGTKTLKLESNLFD